MLVNKTVEFFLSEAAGWSRRSAVSGGGLGRDTGGKITGQAAGLERPGTGRNAGEDRGLGRDKMPAGAKAGAGTKCRRGPRLSRQGANQLKRKRSIISSSNSGFSKSFSLVMIKLLCSKNPASW